MTGLALLLLAVAGVLLVLGLVTIALAPLMAARAAATTTRPKLERRASGPDRMRVLITAQRTERGRRSGLSTTLTRTGMALSVLAILTFVGGIVAWAMGF
jgi:hypothetical protein